MDDLYSVIVCTYNRATSLRNTLTALAAQRTDGFDYEVLVVDNNSSDDTAQVVQEARARFGERFRSLVEPRQGKPYALNAGVAAARGAWLVFTDDDATAPPDWLRVIRETFKAQAADSVYGKVLPVWQAPRR